MPRLNHNSTAIAFCTL